MKESEERELLETIDRYLLGQMSEEEKNAFEKRINNDPVVRQEVDDAKAFLCAISDEKGQAVKERLERTNEMVNEIRSTTEVDYDSYAKAGDDSSKGKVKRLQPSIRKFLGYAAAVLIIAMIPLYFIFMQETPTKRLYDQYYEPSPGFVKDVTRSATDLNRDQLQSIGVAYKEGNYAKALQRTDQYLKNHDDVASLRFYRGIMHLELGNYQQAIQDFKQVQKNSDQYRDRAMWYLALAYLADKEKQQAKKVLQQLQQRPPTRFNEKAEELLADMD